MGKQFRPIKVTPNQWMKIFENRQIEVSLFEDPKLNPGDMVVVNPVKTDGRVLDGLPLPGTWPRARRCRRR